MYKVRLNTPGIQYWVSHFDVESEDLVLTNIAKDAATISDIEIPFLEGVINETFENGCIVEGGGVMSGDKYVAAVWVDYAKHGNGFKILSCARLYNHKPTKTEALEDFGEDAEGYEPDKLVHFDGVECWGAFNDYAGFGDPAYCLLTISTEGQMDKILDSIARSMREKIK
mgnify:CR=1 FL=1|nr:MAG TPA: hypothetical protein [Caudoviricetes sp.]